MKHPFAQHLRQLLAAITLATACGAACAQASLPGNHATQALSVQALGSQMQVGDLVFIQVDAKPFREVAAATGSWTNHVGIVVDVSGAQPIIAESTIPFSKTGPLDHFVRRSVGGRLALMRLGTALTPQQQTALRAAVAERTGVLYDTGFDIHSSRQFCSRFVREVLQQATGVAVGDVETLKTLFEHGANVNLPFWKSWYLGNIPWNRETVTPASVLHSPALHAIFDGAITAAHAR